MFPVTTTSHAFDLHNSKRIPSPPYPMNMPTHNPRPLAPPCTQPPHFPLHPLRYPLRNSNTPVRPCMAAHTHRDLPSALLALALLTKPQLDQFLHCALNGFRSGPVA